MHKTLLLVDGSSYLYRAFHALPDLRSPDGAPTGALYGIINMLRRLRHDYPASYLACVFDARGKTFRDDLYQEYKANRSAMPEDLVAQIEPIHEAVRILGWPILMVEGVEADDVIGTLAKQAAANGMETIISTGDKDMAQLVNGHVTLVNTMSNEKLDREGVAAKFGVPPERIPDYLSLIGDTSDNVPGVAKVGPKTAVKWMTQYGSLDGIMANADKITGAVGENLRNTLDWLPKAHELVTIRTDCDLSAHLASVEDTLKGKPEDIEAMKAFFARYGFKSWLRELGAGPAAPKRAARPAQEGTIASLQDSLPLSAPVAANYETVVTQERLAHWLKLIDAASLTSIDTETTSLEPMRAQLVGISLCCEPGVAAYIPLAHAYQDAPEQMLREQVLSALRSWLEDPGKPKVGQNLKYDSHVFANHGISLRGIAHDTMLESYVLEAHRSHDMDSLALRHLDRKTITYQEVCGKGAAQIGFDQVPVERATEYAAEDADVTLQLHHALWPRIERDSKLRFIYEQIELPTAVTLHKIERNGVLIDRDKLAAQSQELGVHMLSLEQGAYEAAGQPFNLNSPKQIGEIFFDRLQLPVVKKTPSGSPSTDEEVLQKLAEDYPLPKMLLEYRGLSKLKSTYADKLPKMVNPATGRVHTNFAQAVAVTGRLASNDPNLQNIPVRTAEGRRIREAFIAPTGSMIVSADYSQIELRIMAHISGDANLLRAFAEGEDVHRATASEIFGVTPLEVSGEQRRYAKVINFGLIYGMSEFGLASNLGIERSAARNYIDRYFRRYPGVAHYMADIRAQAKAQGYVETVFGRRLWLPEINSPNGPRRQAAERAAINAPMQGTAADLIKLSMIAVQRWLESERLLSKMILQVHDELVLEVPESELSRVRDELPKIMCSVAQLKVPLVADVGIGHNWDEAH
ncbi:MAG: DNA polymerase I [Burkholderiaceae bacterium]|nr:DNA polymerase I [Burkholderiaceae bacterium]